MDETLRKMMLDEAVANAQQHARLLASDEAAIATLTSGEDVQPVWSIMISSAWATEGEKSHTGDYATPTLREAIRQAATDFCVKNRRIYPGRPADRGRPINEPFSKHPDHWDKWDVQGDWYVSAFVGDWSFAVPRASYEHHVAELRESTDEIWGPERKALERKATPKIA